MNERLKGSTQRLNDLLMTSDLDVLEATLHLMRRAAQQYRRTDRIGEERVLQLAQGWHIIGQSVDIARLADPAYEPPASLATASFQFYRKAGAGGAEGMTTVTLDDLQSEENRDKADVELMAAAVIKHHVPASAHLGLLQRIRVARAAHDTSARCRLLSLRCFALAILPSVTSDTVIQTRLFVYEPDLVARITDLVHPERGISAKLRAAGLHALEGIARTRSKLNEVMAAVNVTVSHGILMQLLRFATNPLETFTGGPFMSSKVIDAH
jgi:E3 ubiquitin-protein ligase HUWE1